MKKISDFWKPVLSAVCGLFFAQSALAAVAVSESDIASAVKKEFVNQGEDGALELEFFGGQTSFSLSDAASFKILVSALKYDEQQDKFSCQAEIYGDGKLAAATVLSGKFFRMSDVVVPARNIKKGEIISEPDLKVISIRTGRLKNPHVCEKEKIVGKEAKRMLKEGRLILENDIGDKVLIKKGDVVTTVYATPHMQITAKAQALEDGAEGERISLQNIKSKKNLYGEVLNAETVRVDVQ